MTSPAPESAPEFVGAAFGYLALPSATPTPDVRPEVRKLYDLAAARGLLSAATFIDTPGQRTQFDHMCRMARAYARDSPGRVVVLLLSRDHLGTGRDVQAAMLADLDHADTDVLILDELPVPAQTGTAPPGTTVETADPT